eukprot:818538-Pelagomonas_calceolata.AAC.1
MSVCDIAVALPPCAGARTGVRGPCSGFKIRHMNWLYKEQEKPFANSASHHLNQALSQPHVGHSRQKFQGSAEMRLKRLKSG